MPTAAGVERLDPAGGAHSRLLTANGITSIALSRDANFLYVIAQGSFTTYPTAGGAQVGSFATSWSNIVLVAGG